jgi:hypothetical protein
MPAVAVEAPDVTVLQHGQKAVRIQTGLAAVDVSRTPLRLKVRDLVNGRRLLRGARGGTLAYERGATTHVLGEVTAVTPLPDGAVLDVATDEGMPATVTVRFLTRRTVEIALDPPDAGGVGVMRARFLSPEREAIYAEAADQLLETQQKLVSQLEAVVDQVQTLKANEAPVQKPRAIA